MRTDTFVSAPPADELASVLVRTSTLAADPDRLVCGFLCAQPDVVACLRVLATLRFQQLVQAALHGQ